jgi:hypothetical protein
MTRHWRFDMRGIDKSEMENARCRSLTLLACLALAVLPTGVHARIGETLAECETRYGAPLEKRPDDGQNGEQARFKKDSVIITVYFGPDGRAWSVSYKTMEDFRQEFTEDEIEYLLTISGFSKWSRRQTQNKGSRVVEEVAVFTDETGLAARWTRIECSAKSKNPYTDYLTVTTQNARKAIAAATLHGF